MPLNSNKISREMCHHGIIYLIIVSPIALTYLFPKFYGIFQVNGFVNGPKSTALTTENSPLADFKGIVCKLQISILQSVTIHVSIKLENLHFRPGKIRTQDLIQLHRLLLLLFAFVYEYLVEAVNCVNCLTKCWVQNIFTGLKMIYRMVV